MFLSLPIFPPDKLLRRAREMSSSGRVFCIFLISAIFLLVSNMPKSFISEKTAPTGPLTFSTKLLPTPVSPTLFSHLPPVVQATREQKHGAAHPNWGSISKLPIPKIDESETEKFIPAALANCLLDTSLWVGTMPRTLALPGTSAEVCRCLSSHVHLPEIVLSSW